MNEVLKNALKLEEMKLRIKNRLIILGLKRGEANSLWLDIEELLNLVDERRKDV